jgi:hypothetical protein
VDDVAVVVSLVVVLVVVSLVVLFVVAVLIVVLVVGSDVGSGEDEPSALGTNAGVGFEEPPNPPLLRAFTFAVNATPLGSPETVIGLVVPSAW